MLYVDMLYIDSGFVPTEWYRMKYAKREFASPAGQVFNIA